MWEREGLLSQFDTERAWIFLRLRESETIGDFWVALRVPLAGFMLAVRSLEMLVTLSLGEDPFYWVSLFYIAYSKSSLVFSVNLDGKTVIRFCEADIFQVSVTVRDGFVRRHWPNSFFPFLLTLNC